MLARARAQGPASEAKGASAGGAREVPWLEEIRRAPANLPRDAPRLRSLLRAAEGGAVRELREWKARREAIRRWWLGFLGELEGPARRQPPRLEILSEARLGTLSRKLVRYEVEPGVRTEAYLIEPEGGAKARRGGVAVFHSTVQHSILQPAGIEGVREKAFGLHLARLGFVTLSPRNFLWPETRRLDAAGETKRFALRHPRVKGMRKMLHDAQVALDVLASHPRVDPERLGAVGHSLGAKEVLYLAAFDERVRAAAASEGGVGLRFSNWNAPWYLGPEIDTQDFRRSGREHHELLALVAPRAFLLIGGGSADGARSWPFVEAALEVYDLYAREEKLPVRFGLYDHGKGHAVPPEALARILEWFEAYL